MENGISLADAMALRDDNNGFMGGNGMWAFFLLFILAYNGGGFFGGNNGVSKADITQGFDFNNLNRQVLDINNKLGENTYLIKGAIDNCCCNTARAIDGIGTQLCNQTNALTNAIHAEGETTRALINANTMQHLRDENQALKFNISQQVQTKNILDNLGRYVTNEPCPQYPYAYGFGGCGTCGFQN